MDAAFADCYRPDIGAPVKTGSNRWRNRVGVERLEELLKETIALAIREKHLPKNDLARIAVDTTNRRNGFVASHLCEDNPYDGHTLAATLAATENVTGVAVTDAYVDNGYRGHRTTGGAEVYIAGQRKENTTRAECKRRRRRSAIEPKIGHLKSDHRMGRCFLARLAGDAINAVPAAAGSNLRKLLGLLRRKCGGLFLRSIVQQPSWLLP